MFNNVNLWFAKDIDNNIITIDEVDVNSNNKTKYYCPLCGSDLIPKAINSKQITAHFAHVDASKCNLESYLHFWFKHKFLESGDKFKVVSDKEREYVCKEILVEQSYTIGDRLYRPDVTIRTECGNVIYFEMKFSNEKKLKDYIDIWLELKNIVVEIDIKKLMSKDKLPVFNALFYDGKCFNVKKGDLYHETIGRHKENLFKSNDISDKLKERIQKLDWFWEEIVNYKKDKIDIESITDFIDYSESEDKILIFEILSKKKCTPIYEDYVNYKVNLFEKLAKDLIDNKDIFSLEKLKIGRKYKNIKYNNIKILTSYLYDYSKFEVNSFTKEEYILKINNFIKKIMNIKIYYDRAKEICLLVKYNDKYKMISDKLEINLNKNNNDEYLYKFSLNRNYRNHISIFIFNDSINYGSKIIYIDILDKNNESSIFKFISNALNTEIRKYTYWKINENRKIKELHNKRQEEEMIKQEKTLQEIKEGRNNFNLVINKIVEIFENNSNKIITYQTNYTLEDKCNLLYFKDYRGIEYIIHGRYHHLHEINPKMKNYSNIFNNYQSNCKLIEIDFNHNPKDNIYIVETEDSYKISWYIKELSYEFPKIFNDIKINLSFKNMDYNIKNLLRYDFINATNKLDNLLNTISSLEDIFSIDYYNKYKNKICNPIYNFTDEDINKEIYKILYPIVYLVEKNANETLNFKLNIDFTIQDGKKQPWLIKNFIETLHKFNIKNVYNII